jgi:hypothetical protein
MKATDLAGHGFAYRLAQYRLQRSSPRPEPRFCRLATSFTYTPLTIVSLGPYCNIALSALTLRNCQFLTPRRSTQSRPRPTGRPFSYQVVTLADCPSGCEYLKPDRMKVLWTESGRGSSFLRNIDADLTLGGSKWP